MNPYYNIRTDVLDDSQYYGGKNSNQPLPIIATIATSSDYNNFFVSLDGGLEFTFTKNKIITSIRTSITDPDGTVADISGNSAVIYKLIKTLPVERLDVLGSFLNIIMVPDSHVILRAYNDCRLFCTPGGSYTQYHMVSAYVPSNL